MNAWEWIRPYYLRWCYFPLFPDARPRYFSDCWQYPFQALTPETASRAVSLLGEPRRAPDLLFLPMTDWHARVQRTQHLARAFAALGHRSFYLNPHLGREFPRPYIFDKISRLSVLEPGVGELHIHLPREPVFHHRLLTDRENRLLLEALELLLSAAGASRTVQVVSFPLWLDVARALKQRHGIPIVYDCHDLLAGFSGIASEIVAREAELLEACDLAVFSSANLLDTMTGEFPWLAAKSLLLRNAADFSHFAQCSPSSEPSSKVVGYIGSLNSWLDIESIRQAALRHPEWKFQLIGRVEDQRVLELTKLRNVEFRGEVSYRELPRPMAEFDVALIPFLRNRLTMATNPIKIYEYFSCGLPVVSTRLPELEQFGDLVYLASDAREFAALVEKAAAERDPSLKERRIALARKETWTSRVTLLLKEFERLFAPADA
jgi:glycosyltransferase involved in cell wall biosynthesis